MSVVKWTTKKQLSAVRIDYSNTELKKIRSEILSLCDHYMNIREKPTYEPGVDIIPASSKILDSSDLKALVDSSLDLWLTSGRYAEEFSDQIAKKFNLKKAILTVSGSSANLLAFSALTSPKLGNKRIKKGDEVITVAAGFPTTVFPIIQNNCVPVFVDINLNNYNIDTNQLQKALTKKTKAIMIAHTMGNPFDLEKVSNFCKKNGLYLIEDCCDAFGAEFKGKHVGTFGDLATMSFYPAHHITAGEGGAVVGNNLRLLRLVESFRDWGRDCYCHTGMNNTCGKRFNWRLGKLPYGYDHKFIYSHIGYNMKMTDMQAAIGFSQIKKLNTFIKLRRRNFEIFTKILKEKKLDQHFILPKKTKNSEPSWFGYMLTIKNNLDRKKIIEHLEKNKILTRLLFAGNLTRQPAFEDVKYRVSGSLKVTDRVMKNSFWLGIWPALDAKHFKYMSKILDEAVRNQIK